MRMRIPSWGIIILLIAAIGLVAKLFTNPKDLIIPALIVAVIFIAYKFLPKRGTAAPKVKKSARTEAKLKAMKSPAQQPRRKSTTERRRSTADLRVIEGSKPKSKSKSEP